MGVLDALNLVAFMDREDAIALPLTEGSAVTVSIDTVADVIRLGSTESAAAFVLVAGVDSFVSGPTLAAYEARERLLTSQNSNGFIPGEGAAAVLVASRFSVHANCADPSIVLPGTRSARVSLTM